MANELQSLSQLFQKRLFRIPDYQRGYAWKQTQLVDFWDDINNLHADRYHYTGLLSLKSLGQNETKNWGSDVWMINEGYKPCHVVDGQQRLTTIIILLNELVCFVRELGEHEDKRDEDIVIGDDNLKEVIEKYICRKRSHKSTVITYLFRYEINNPSDEYLRHGVFNEPYPRELTETYYTKNLKTAKDFFAKNIYELYEKEGIDGISCLYHKLTKKLMFNLHEIDDDYDVFVAFETMNNRGKRLSTLELLKNRLIYLTTIYNDSIIDEIDKAELREEINEAWKEVYSQLGKNKSIALSDDEFLRAHWIIYYSYSRDEYIKFLLEKKFSTKNVFEKKTVSIFESSDEHSIDFEYEDDEEYVVVDAELEPNDGSKLLPSEISEYVNSLKDLAKYWYDTYFPYESTNLTDEEKLWIDRLNRIGISYFRPLVTVALCKGTNETEHIELFKAIERFIFICFRLGGAYRSSYRRTVYYNVARDIYHGKESVNKVTSELIKNTKSNIQYAIKTFANYIEKKFNSGKCGGYYDWTSLRYFLYEYEYSLVESNGIKKISWELFSKSEKDEVTIEHILPQTPTNLYWRNQFRQFIDNQKEMTILTGSLGNLLPLSKSINSSLQNDSFYEKKNPTQEGRRGYASGSYSEIEVAKEDDWNAKKIHDRSVRLLNFMAENWDITFSESQKEMLSFDDFISDGREIPEEITEDNILDVTFPADKSNSNRSKFIAYINMFFATRKDNLGEIHIVQNSCDRQYVRYTTDAMNRILPDAPDAASGWGTKNHYFYEIVNNDGKSVHMQLALSAKNIPDNLKKICDKINDYFPSKHQRKNWKYRHPFVTSQVSIPEDMSVEDILKVLNEQYAQIQSFEKKLTDVMN